MVHSARVPQKSTGFLASQSSDAPSDFRSWPVAKCRSIPTPACFSLREGEPGRVALPLHFPTQPLVLVNVAKMGVLLAFVCSWNSQPGDIHKVTEWGVSSSQDGLQTLPPTWEESDRRPNIKKKNNV